MDQPRTSPSATFLAITARPVVLSQTFRSLIHSRMRVGMSKYDTQFEDAKVILFEPDRHDSQMFFTNVFKFSDRKAVCQHAYHSTRKQLLQRRAELGRFAPPKLDDVGQ